MGRAPSVPAARVRAPPLTHFLGLSLVMPASRPQLQASLDAFKDAARNDKELHIPDHVAKHAIRPVDTLHLTICTFSLPEKEPEKLQEVISHLKELDLKKLWQEAYDSKHLKNASTENSTQPSQSQDEKSLQAQQKAQVQDEHGDQGHQLGNCPPLRVTLKGVSTIRGPASTTVVYAPPEDPTGALQRFCESIRDDFRPYLPRVPSPRNSEPGVADSGVLPEPAKRPTLESFPHPDSYKSDISIPSTPAPPASLERPISPPEPKPAAEGTSVTSLSEKPHLSHRQQKRLLKQDAGQLPHLLLHATLLNTIYVRGRKNKPLKIDARPLLELFKDTVWMKDVQIEKLCLYRMGAKEVLDDDGEGTGVVRYVAEAERDLQ